MKILSAKLTGNPEPGGWSQVHDFIPSDPVKRQSRGRLFAVISAPDGSIGRELITRLHEEYFGDTTGPAYDALKKAVEKVWNENNGDTTVKISACSVVGGELYASVAGLSEISIFRGGNFSKIVVGSTGTHFVKGPILTDDIIVLSTSEFFDGIADGVIKAAFNEGTPETIIEAFGPMIHANSGQGVKGSVVIKFENDDEPQLSTADELPTPERPKINFNLFKNKFPRRKVFVKGAQSEEAESRKRKTTATVGVILLALLVISIVFGARQKSVKSTQEKYNTKLAEIRHNIEEGKALFSLNPERARELFAASANLISEVEKEKPSEEISELKKLYDEGKQSVLGEFEVAGDEYLDLTLIDGLRASKLAATSEAMYVYDEARKRVVEVTLDTKKTEVVVGPSQLGDIEELTAYTGRVYVAEGEGVFEVGSSRSKVLDKQWTGDILLYAYAGNIYVLEKGNSVIWRFPATPTGIGKGSNWLAPGISVDLSSVVSWAIDGSVWILTASGKVEKYSFGSPQNLNTIRVIPEMKNPTAIYTNEELQNLYILDPATERVIVFDKEGKYKSQYKSGILKEAIGLAASEKEGKIIVLTKEKLYSLPINN